MKLKQYVEALVKGPLLMRVLLLGLVLVSVIFTIQNLTGPPKMFWDDVHYYTNYNNYVIFKYSFPHLLDNKNLYNYYFDEYADLYKYSPTFALFMYPFQLLPDWIGLLCWNLINTLVLFFGVQRISHLPTKKQAWIILLILLELTVSMRNSQSNALITGLALLSYDAFERKKTGWAALLICLNFYVKVYGLIAAILFLFYPEKIKFCAYMVLWMLIFLFAPLIVISPTELWGQYLNWKELLQADQAASVGISVDGILHTWFHIDAKKPITIIGMLLLFLPLMRYKQYVSSSFRHLFLSYMLIFLVIFNHKAESPTYIIAVTGIAFWYFAQPRGTGDLILLIASIAIISLIISDLVPRSWKDNFLYPYHIKAVPAIIVWIKAGYELMCGRFTQGIKKSEV